MAFTDAGTQEAVVQVGGHGNMVQGTWAVRCLKTTREMPRGQLDVEQRGQSWRETGSHQHPGGKSGVCVEAHLGEGVRGEECRLVPGEHQRGRRGSKKELAEETRSPSQQVSPEGKQQGNNASATWI